MANTATISASLSYEDAVSPMVAMILSEITASVATGKYLSHKQSIGFSAAEAIVLGECTAPGWFLAINRDLTNFTTILTGTGGVIFAKLLPGEGCLLRLGSGAQAPFAQSDTGACVLEYFVIQT